MLEAAAIPLLLKAVDFLFGEGSKILQERRERRATQQQETKTEPATSAPTPDQPNLGSVSANAILTKEESLDQQVDQSNWSIHQREVEHLLSLLTIYSRNYYLAKEQYAKWGSALVPPIIVNNLEEAENNVAETSRKLQVALKAVYGKVIIVPELEKENE